VTRMTRVALIAGALCYLTLAAGTFLFAADIASWRDAILRDDVRYRVAPDQDGLWQPAVVLPFNIAGRALGVRDDVRFREALRALRLGRLELGITSDPKLALSRAEARARLQEIAGSGGGPRRRSRAMGLLGVLSYSSAITEARDQDLYIRDATAAFEGAIALDPANDEAKVNLELALQKRRALQPSEGAGGPNPSPGGAGAKGAGAGTPGSGY
jgi:hypothetical protein